MIFLVPALLLTSCSVITKKEPPGMPSSFQSEVIGKYGSAEYKFTLKCGNYNDINMVFTSPQPIVVKITDSAAGITYKEASTTISYDLLPTDGFIKMFASSVRKCVYNNTGEPVYDGTYYTYSSSTECGNVKMFMNGKTGSIEKIEISDKKFSAVFSDFTINS